MKRRYFSVLLVIFLAKCLRDSKKSSTFAAIFRFLQMQRTFKIGLVGPESTGKSTLALALAERLSGTCIPEFARDYVGGLHRPYTYEDVCLIAEQNRREALSAEGLTFFDTELIITKVWLDEVYGKRPGWLTEPVPPACQMDFYLLLVPDLPAVPDPLRENLEQSARERLFRIYLHEIELTGKPFAVISGLGEERLRSALLSVEGAMAT